MKAPAFYPWGSLRCLNTCSCIAIHELPHNKCRSHFKLILKIPNVQKNRSILEYVSTQGLWRKEIDCQIEDAMWSETSDIPAILVGLSRLEAAMYLDKRPRAVMPPIRGVEAYGVAVGGCHTVAV